tara:strand:- start:9732 stop:9890 length:159 start_codon:yes stop_codon:yes gene_type:complete
MRSDELLECTDIRGGTKNSIIEDLWILNRLEDIILNLTILVEDPTDNDVWTS